MIHISPVLASRANIYRKGIKFADDDAVVGQFGSESVSFIPQFPSNRGVSLRNRAEYGGLYPMRSLGFAQGSVVQEFGYDDDVDNVVREAVEEATGQELVDEDYPDVADGAIAWWRDDDGDADDLADLLLDVKANLDSDDSLCWVLVPAPRSAGHVTTDVIEEAAETAGLLATTSVAIGDSWLGVRLTAQGPRR